MDACVADTSGEGSAVGRASAVETHFARGERREEMLVRSSHETDVLLRGCCFEESS